MINYWPTRDMDAYLRLESRVMARMALLDAAASGSDDPFTEDDLREGAQLELNFRDRQLLRLRDEVLDLDDLADGVVMSDLTMDYFLAQLRQYLEKNRDELEATPKGAYAVAPAPPGGPGPGAIFVLRQSNASNDKRQRPASPVHPYYLACVLDNGSIRYGCGAARHVLDAFEKAAQGRTDPLVQLCDEFDRETAHGADMARYDALLNNVVAQIRQAHVETQAKGLASGKGFVLSKASESPHGAGDFELVTWLVLR